MAIPYYRWFPGDYARDTRHLSLMQHGVYRLLIDLYMDQGEPLPNDLAYLYRWLHAESVEEKNAVEFVLGEFFELRETHWFHKRCDDELRWRLAKSKEAKDSAKRRWDANAMRTHSERNANQNQNQNRARPKKSRCPGEFEVTESMAKWAQAKGLAPSKVIPETEKFLDHHRAKGSLMLDWTAAWQNWVRNAIEFVR